MADTDRIKRSFRAAVRQVMRGADYLAFYPCRVASQNADGTLELVPDNDTIPHQSKVPIRGLPGVAVKVTGSARCLLGWEGGDPTRPVAAMHQIEGIQTIYLGGAQPDGSDVPNFVALANLVLNELNGIRTTFNGHMHPTAATGPPSPPTVPMSPIGAVAAAKTKAL